ncbi:hypothetical protein GCM10020229_23630 [Kitasatospora albolonga]|uniref:hypothetical protein n=1 Tax=Kitasatospora albolonga TaxID=68173 RepID=UPI0031EB6B07
MTCAPFTPSVWAAYPPVRRPSRYHSGHRSQQGRAGDGLSHHRRGARHVGGDHRGGAGAAAVRPQRAAEQERRPGHRQGRADHRADRAPAPHPAPLPDRLADQIAEGWRVQ